MIDPAAQAAADAAAAKQKEFEEMLKVFEFPPRKIEGEGILTINTPNGPEDHPVYLRYLSEGGYGAVYNAVLKPGDPLKGSRPLVVKIALGTGPDGMKDREGREKSILNEVNIVNPKCGAAVIDRAGSVSIPLLGGRTVQSRCSISEHHGQTLNNYIYEVLKGSPPGGWVDDRQARQAAEMMVQLTTQLLESGKIHGDIKPENIFANKNPVTGHPVAKLGDWGSCVPNDGCHAPTVGTPQFAGPELAGVTTERKDQSSFMIDGSERNLRTDRRDAFSLMASLSELANSQDFTAHSPQRAEAMKLVDEAFNSLPKDLDPDRLRKLEENRNFLEGLLGSTQPSFREYENIHDPELRTAWQAVHAAATDPDISRRSSIDDLRVHSLLLVDRSDMPRLFTAQQINDMGAHLAASFGDQRSQHLAPLNIAASFVLTSDPRMDPQLVKDLEKLRCHAMLNDPPQMSEFVVQERIQSRVYAQKANEFCKKELLEFLKVAEATKKSHALKDQNKPVEARAGPTPPNRDKGYISPIPPKKPNGPTR